MQTTVTLQETAEQLKDNPQTNTEICNIQASTHNRESFNKRYYQVSK